MTKMMSIAVLAAALSAGAAFAQEAELRADRGTPGVETREQAAPARARRTLAELKVLFRERMRGSNQGWLFR